jgi:hypothetical protein
MQFDVLFATTTGYTALDQRISMVRNKRKSLLLVLDHPFLLLLWPTIDQYSSLCTKNLTQYLDLCEKLGNWRAFFRAYDILRLDFLVSFLLLSDRQLFL